MASIAERLQWIHEITDCDLSLETKQSLIDYLNSDPEGWSREAIVAGLRDRIDLLAEKLERSLSPWILDRQLGCPVGQEAIKRLLKNDPRMKVETVLLFDRWLTERGV